MLKVAVDGWILDDDVLLGGGGHERRGLDFDRAGRRVHRPPRRRGRAGCLSAGWERPSTCCGAGGAFRGGGK